MCIGINDSPTTPGYDPRYMPLLYSAQTGYRLAYGLYQDPTGTIPIGGFGSGGAAKPLAVVKTVAPYYGGGSDITVYGRINPSGQQGDRKSTRLNYSH